MIITKAEEKAVDITEEQRKMIARFKYAIFLLINIDIFSELSSNPGGKKR